MGTGLRLGRPSIIQGFQLNGVTIAAVAIARLQRRPLVIKVAGRVNITSLLTTRQRRAKLFFMLRSAQAVVAPSASCMEDLKRLGIPGRKVRMIANGVDTSAFHPPTREDRDRARSEFGFDEDAVVFAWVARLDPGKGFDRVGAAWKDLLPRCPRSRLLIAGSGPRDEEARTLAADFPGSVVWLGLLPDVRAVHAAADSLITASSSEGLSNSLIEAMASGLPAVVSSIDENVDVDPGGRFLIPFDRDSTGALVSALRRMYELDCGKRKAMGEAARCRAVNSYDIRITAERWSELYSSLDLSGT